MPLLLNTLFTFLFFAFVHSRNPPNLNTNRIATLDISAAIQRSRDVLVSETKWPSQHFNEEDSLVMRVQPRVSVQKAEAEDYKAVVMARLARDSARVDYIEKKLDLALNGVGLSDLEFGSSELQGPVVSGTSQGSGEYFSRVAIGKPPSSVYMVLDTGSDVNWVQCAPCADCYQQADPIFEPASSASYAPLACATEQCRSLDVSECRNGTCLYEVSYGDGSYTVGEFVTETITLGSTPVQNIAIGCGHNNEGLFIGAAGLLGLGGGSLSFPSQLNASSFSYCLVDRDSDSASTLEFDSPLPPNAVTAPLIKNPQLETFYYLGLAGISVGGEMLPLPATAFEIDAAGNGGIIVDSGTAVTRLQTELYNSLRDSFVRGSRHLPVTSGVALFDTCYDLSSRNSVEVPTVSFHFGEGKELQLPANNYLIPVDSDGTFCFAFAPTGSGLSIIGNVQQQGTRVGFDLRKSLVGFSPSNC